MKVIKFLGKVLAAPISLTLFIITIGLLPIKLLINWLTGDWGFVKAKWGAFKTFLKKGLKAIDRGERPWLGRILVYQDNNEHIYFFDDKNNYQLIDIATNGKTK